MHDNQELTLVACNAEQCVLDKDRVSRSKQSRSISFSVMPQEELVVLCILLTNNIA
jgi:hypothetical protein